MTESDLVSIIVPTFNGSKYIREAIESALKQSYPSKEVLVVDDQSTDATLSVLEEYSDVKVVRTPTRLGSDLASNYGVQRTAGEYISLLGHDDVLCEGKTTKVLAALVEGDRDIAYADAITIDENGHETGAIKGLPYRNRGALLRRNIILLGTAVIRRTYWDRFGGFRDFEGYGDYDLWLRSSGSWRPAYVSEWVLLYRQHSGQLGHVHPWTKMIAEGRLLDAIRGQAKKYHVWLLLREIRRQTREAIRSDVGRNESSRT